ncbi:hypothetical protein [Acinetobacter venetianus]|uniref:hypothetical protein n=1 Tax=Acinetobacter venetianus TaxID=52133 RepID=UPI000B1BD679|nr:hypothetical protein [Acinetobacter venetianus]
MSNSIKPVTVGAMDHSHIAAFQRFIAVIKAVANLPVATVKEVRNSAIPNLSCRQVQIYLKNLVETGYLRAVGNGSSEYRYYLTEQSKQLFNVTKHDGEGR